MDFWQNTAFIDGWFSYEEAQQYHALLCTLPDYATVVEVGIYHGRSTSVPAQLSLTKPLKLSCVDTFGMDHDGTPYLDKFIANMTKLGVTKYEVFAGNSEKAQHAFALESVDLVFIDADHYEAGVTMDCDVWLPRLKHGGIAVFHDYDPGNFPDVFTAVNRFCQGWEGSHVHSLAWRRKP